MATSKLGLGSLEGKWKGGLTEEVHLTFMEELKRRHPSIQKHLDTICRVYKDNKELKYYFRKWEDTELLEIKDKLDARIKSISLNNLLGNSKKYFNILKRRDKKN